VKYLRLWWRLAVMSFLVQADSPVSSMSYFLGKLARLGFFFIFLIAIFRHTNSVAGYSFNETALFFLTFNLVDVLGQLLFRGIYGIRSLIREGQYDYYLIQPTSTLYRVAFSTVDFLDLMTLLPVLFLTALVMHRIAGEWRWFPTVSYVVLALNGLLIAFAIHVAVASLSVWTQELENTIWIYRDLMTLGRFPSDIYAKTMQRVLTFGVPIAVMVSFPAKAFLGKLSPAWFAGALLISVGSVALSLRFWSFANRRYTSVSS
jgi:ABC-2 type transport system permease protein